MQRVRVAEIERLNGPIPERGLFGFDEAVWLVYGEPAIAALGYVDGQDRSIALLWDGTRLGKLGAARLARVIFDYSDSDGLEVVFWAHGNPSEGFVALIERCGFVETAREYRRPVGARGLERRALNESAT